MTEPIAKNTLYLTAASVIQKAMAFGYFLLVARFLAPEQTGVYFLALSVVTIVSVVAQFGFPSVVVREVARLEPEVARKRLRHVLSLLVPLIALAGILAQVLTAFVFHYGPEVQKLVLIGLVVIASDALSLLFFAVLRGLHRLEYESIGVLTGQMVTVGIGVGALYLHPSLSALMVALAGGSLFNAMYSGFWVMRRFGVRSLLPLFPSLQEVSTLFVVTLPFAIAAAAAKVYSYVDSLFLGKVIGPEAVAIYGVAYKFTYAFQFLPLAFVASLYPALSARLHRKDPEVKDIFLRSVWYMGLLAFPITFGIWVVADELVSLTGGKYTAAAGVLRLLIFALIPIFLDFPIGSLLNAADKQAVKTRILVYTMLVNVVLNAILIPFFGPAGAAAAGVVSFSFLFLAGLAQVRSILPEVTMRDFAKRLLPLCVSAFGMAVVSFVVLQKGGFIAALVAGAVSYPLFLMATRGFTKKDARMILALVRRAS